MSEWKPMRLGSHAAIRGRIGWKGLKSNEYMVDGPYLVAGNHIVGHKIDWSSCQHISRFRYDESPEIKLLPDDIIITKDGTIGRVAFIDWLPGDSTINSTMMLVRIVNRTVLEPRYAFFGFQGGQFQKLVAERVAGSGVPHLFQADMKELVLDCPSLPEQRKIARILTTVDNLIEKAEALIEKYKSIKQGMMHDLFTRGVDSNGQLRPAYKEAPELYKPSEIGWLPKEWIDCQWGEFVKKWGYGPRFNAANYSEIGNARTIRGTDFTDDGHINYRQVPLALLPHAMVTRHQLDQNDLVVVTTADCGVSAVFEVQECPFIASAYAVAFRFNENVNPYYVNYFMRTDLSKRQVNKYVRQGTVGNLPGSDLLTFRMPLPSLDEQRDCVRRLDSLSETTRQQHDYLQKLKVTKSGLMQDLLTGKVRVTVVETEEVTANV